MPDAKSRWLDDVASRRLSGCFNPWRDRNDLDLPEDGPNARLLRLSNHLGDLNADWLLVGEALGFKGGRFAGAGFCSEGLLFDGAIPRLEYCKQRRITSRPKPFREPSATIVWRTLYRAGIAESVLTWNAFPYHPFRTGAYTNRTPTQAELNECITLLDGLAAMATRARLIAVGQKAAHSLSLLGRPFKAIRHPSMGGATEFENGLIRIVRSTRS